MGSNETGTAPRVTVVEHGEIFGPEPRGRQAVLALGPTIAQIGDVDVAAARRLKTPLTVIDATDCYVVPGLIDPHEHLLGAGGEQGWGSRTGEVTADELVRAGITTVVGCLGTDTTMRGLPALLAKARQLAAMGLTARIYTGGFWVPPRTLTGGIMEDLAIVSEVIGVGEVAIADARSADPNLDSLAQLVSQGLVGGSLAGKVGVTHFHVGGAERRLAPLRALLDEHDTSPRHLYPTHINRSPELLSEAIALACRGAFVDLDTVDDDLPQQLRAYIAGGGPLRQLTVSSDAQTPGGSPTKLYRNIVCAAQETGLPLADVLALATRNPATALGLGAKGTLAVGQDADLLVLERETLAVRYVVAGGRVLLADGKLALEQEEQDE